MEEDEIALLQIAALPDAPVARSTAKIELVCRRMWEIGAMCQECPTGETRAVESIRRCSAGGVVNSKLALGPALEVETFPAEVVEGVRCGWATGDQDQRPQDYGGQMLQKPKTQSATRDSHLLVLPAT
jgi:hypothetical protein